MSSIIRSTISTVESQAICAIVAGFSFASAISWMDVVRWIIANLIKVNKSSGSFTLLAAVLTTLLAVVVFMVLKMVQPELQQPSQPMYAVTR